MASGALTLSEFPSSQYSTHMERYFQIQSELLNFETSSLDGQSLSLAIRTIIPTSRHLLDEKNLMLYAETGVPQQAIQNYLRNFQRFREKITLLLLSPLE